MGTYIPKAIRDLAKQFDTPEMRELYRRQKRLNPDLDKDCDELTKEVEDIFKHGVTPDGEKE